MSIEQRIDQYVEAAGLVLDAMPAEQILAIDVQNEWVGTISDVFPEDYSETAIFLVQNTPGRPKTLWDFSQEFSHFSPEKANEVEIDEVEILCFTRAFRRAIELRIFNRKMTGEVHTVDDFLFVIQDITGEHLVDNPDEGAEDDE